MKTFKLILLLFCLIPSFTYSASLTVGCATKCDFFFHLALKKTAKSLGHQVVVEDVSQMGTKIDWQRYDAIIMPGGADIDPKYYLDSLEPEWQEVTRSLDHLVKYSAEGRRRDPIEYNLLKEYFQNPDLKELPVLGVCRGMQMIAVSQGIPLYVDIKTELGIRNRRYLFDTIRPESTDSVMKTLFPNPFRAFKRHHQGVRVDYFHEHSSRWNEVSITSYSNNKMIAESIEFKNRPVLGVQFHPENDFGFERRRIFTWLLSKAVIRRASLLEK